MGRLVHNCLFNLATINNTAEYNGEIEQVHCNQRRLQMDEHRETLMRKETPTTWAPHSGRGSEGFFSLDCQ